MGKTVIHVESLSKRYHLGLLHRQINSFRDRVASLVRRNPDDSRDDTIWALKDVSFQVAEGEILGIIGPNGAGKSTLLKILSRITKPTSGSARIDGRVASLLEVGTGFHPELTGKENIYLNGAILGMRKAEIEKKFDEIVAFAEIGKFIGTPVKRYSSGMYVRLAFAVAAHLQPEILLVDEVLAVGDAAFQKKCLHKMGDVARGGRTVLFVSHNMGAVNTLCEQGMVIDKGRIMYQGEAGESVRHYLHRLSEQDTQGGSGGTATFSVDESKPVQIRTVSMMDGSGTATSVFDYQDSPRVYIGFDMRDPHPDLYALLFIRDIYGNMIFLTSDQDFDESPLGRLGKGQYSYGITLPGRLLKPGHYHLNVSFTRKYKTGQPVDRRDSVLDFEIQDHRSRRGAQNTYRKTALVAPEIHWTLESSTQPLQGNARP